MSSLRKYTPPQLWERVLLGLVRRPLAIMGTVVLGLALWAATAHGFDVTQVPLVQRDLALAESYWHKAAPCAALSVVVEPVGLVTGNNGQVVSGLASTALYGCEIDLSPDIWRWDFLPPTLATFPHPAWERKALWPWAADMQRADSCADIVHEYGHTIGLPDSAGAGIMDDAGPVAAAPICLHAFVPERALRQMHFLH